LYVTGSLENLSFHVSPEVFVALRHIAESEGWQLQAVLDEALREYIERKERGIHVNRWRQPLRIVFGNSICSTVNLRMSEPNYITAYITAAEALANTLSIIEPWL
jgi:hypothetical protein